MSKYSTDELQAGTLIGMTSEHGKAWWGGGHFMGSVPLEEARRLLQTANAELSDLYQVDLPSFDLAADLAALNPDMPYEELHAALMGMLGLSKVESFRLLRNSLNHHEYQCVGATSYDIHQYEWLLELAANVMDESQSKLQLGSVICLGHGEQAMVQVRPSEGLVIGGDRILPWLGIFSSHDSSWATLLKMCTTRAVCDNTSAAAYREDTPSWSIKHTPGDAQRQRWAEVREALGLFFKNTDRIAEEVDRLQQTDVSERHYQRTIDLLFPMTKTVKVKVNGKTVYQDTGIPLEDGRSKTILERKRAAVDSLYRYDMRAAPFQGTAWGVVQAVNTAFTHSFTKQGKSKGVPRYQRQAVQTKTGEIDQVDRQTIVALDTVREKNGLSPVFAGMA